MSRDDARSQILTAKSAVDNAGYALPLSAPPCPQPTRFPNANMTEGRAFYRILFLLSPLSSQRDRHIIGSSLVPQSAAPSPLNPPASQKPRPPPRHQRCSPASTRVPSPLFLSAFSISEFKLLPESALRSGPMAFAGASRTTQAPSNSCRFHANTAADRARLVDLIEGPLKGERGGSPYRAAPADRDHTAP